MATRIYYRAAKTFPVVAVLQAASAWTLLAYLIFPLLMAWVERQRGVTGEYLFFRAGCSLAVIAFCAALLLATIAWVKEPPCYVLMAAALPAAAVLGLTAAHNEMVLLAATMGLAITGLLWWIAASLLAPPDDG